MIDTSLVAGALATVLLELFKWVYRKFVAKDMAFDFPAFVYTIGIPVLSVAVVPFLAFLGMEGYTMPTSLVEFVRTLLLVLLSTLTSLTSYSVGLKPLKTYMESLKE